MTYPENKNDKCDQVKQIVECDGWMADLGCEKECELQEWTGRYGGRNLCRKCAMRLKADSKAWARLTR